MRLLDILVGKGIVSKKEADCPRFVLDNVAHYYWSENEKEYWALKDFPLSRPPFEHLWVEYRMPEYSYSKEVGVTDTRLISGRPDFADVYFGGWIIKMPPDQNIDNDLYGFMCSGWLLDKRNNELLTNSPTRLEALLEFNSPKQHFDRRLSSPGTFSDAEAAASDLYILHPCLMAFSLLNCRNVEEIVIDIPAKFNKRRAERGKPLFHGYRVINVLPMNVHEKREVHIQYGDRVHTKVGAISLRRGSFARYGIDGHGLLFGKYTGVYWRPAIQKATVATYDVKVK